MASEEEKKQNMLRLARLTLFGVTTGIWDLMGDGARGLSHEIGDEILPVLEKEMGLEIAGESPENVLQEVGRLMVDEFGFAKSVDVVADGDILQMKVHTCANRKLTDDLEAAGVGTPFICPFLCVADAVFDRMGIKARTKIERWHEAGGSIITFEVI
ncbi:MAG: hypothetical protein JW934_19325 [Anaerolineae bacterium]|nr:hypothetical protein [Anaerolineae bacterium]